MGADNGAGLLRVGPWLWDWRMSVCVLACNTSLQAIFETSDGRGQAVTDIKSRNSKYRQSSETNSERLVRSTFQPLTASKAQKQARLASGSRHWLASLLLHVMLLTVLVFSTIHEKTKKIPTSMTDVSLAIFFEQKIQQKSVPAGASEGPNENLEHYDKSSAIASSSNPSLANDASRSKLGKVAASVSSVSQPQAFVDEATEKSTELLMKGPNPLMSSKGPSLADKENVQMNADLLPANDGYKRFLKMIERRDVMSDPKHVNVSNFPIELKGSPEIVSVENKSNFTDKNKKTLCSVMTPTRQLQPVDEIKTNDLPKSDFNQAIRITSLLGHGRYAAPSTSVRVADLLNAQSQRSPVNYPSASVTVSDLLRQSSFNNQIACN